MAGFFDTLFGGGAEREAADKNRALTNQYGIDANGNLTSAYNQSRGDVTQGINAYTPLSALGDQYNKAGALNLDALGVNGPEGNARATGAFTNSPGYGAGITAGLDIINRRRGSTGMDASGNADLDALQFAQNSQNKEYQSWLQNLQQAGGTGVNIAGQVAGGQAAGYNTLGNLAQNYGQNQVGIAGNVLSGNTSANTLQAQGEASGAKNLLGAGLSLASLAAGGMGGVAGGMAGMLNSGASSMFGNLMGNQWQQDNTGRWGSSYSGPVR